MANMFTTRDKQRIVQRGISRTTFFPKIFVFIFVISEFQGQAVHAYGFGKNANLGNKIVFYLLYIKSTINKGKFLQILI